MLVAVPTVEVAPTAALAPDRLTEVRALLDAAFGDRFSADDWVHALGGHHVVLSVAGAVAAHAAVVPRVLYVAGQPVRAGYVEAVATAPGRQNQGLGSLVMRSVADLLRAQYELGALSTGRPAFYERLGWERWRGATYVRRGGELVRTPDEDAGILVLRYVAPVDLRADLACDERTGDDW